MALYMGYDKVDPVAIDAHFNVIPHPIGKVSNIRFLIIDNKLSVKWKDPGDTIVSGAVAAKFGGTMLRMKVGSYPENELDGTLVIDSKQINAYNTQPLIYDIPDSGEDAEYYFRFFSYDTDNNFNSETQFSDDNRFDSKSYSWDNVVENLHDFENSRDLVPEVGTQFSLNYVLSDYYLEGTTKKVVDTRQLALDHRDQLSTVSTQWKVVARNSNVPQYVQYRRVNDVDNTLENIFVSSVDDHAEKRVIHFADGTSKEVAINVGDGFESDIVPGRRTYTCEWDPERATKTYHDTGKVVGPIPEGTTYFEYNGDGKASAINTYKAPRKISVGGKLYDFCGYTLTVSPTLCFRSIQTNGKNYADIQFDVAESEYALAYNTFPDYDPDVKYFYLSAGDYHELDWSGMTGHTTQDVKVNGHVVDVFKLEGDRMMNMSRYFDYHRMYFTLDGDTRIPLIPVYEFAIATEYLTSNAIKSYGGNKTWYTTTAGDVVNDYVRYNGKIYRVINNVTTTTCTNIETQNPETLPTYFAEQPSLLTSGHYFVHGARIPRVDGEIEIYEYNNTDRRSYGCNLYSESFYRQYCNNLNGMRDAGYKPQSIFDRVSTSGLANANGLMLKLMKEPQFIKNISSARNICVVSQYHKGYRNIRRKSRYFYECCCDIFWPMGYYELFGGGVDGYTRFDDEGAYPNEESRKKRTMNAAGADPGGANGSYWWMRSPNTGNTYYVLNVTSSGGLIPNNASNSFAFSPACLIA